MRQIILAIVTAYMSYYALMQNFNNSGGGGIEKTIAALAVFGIEIYLISHIRELNKKERFAQGHRLCAGCGAGERIRHIRRAVHERARAAVRYRVGHLRGG